MIYYPRSSCYRYWIFDDDLVERSSVINVRKLNAKTGEISNVGEVELLVGDESVASIVKRELHIIDVRNRPELVDPKNALYKQPEVDYYTDIGYADGLPYQGDAVIIINIPFSRLKYLANKIHDQSYNSLGIDSDIRHIIYENYTHEFGNCGILNILELEELYAWNEDDMEDVNKYIDFINSCYEDARALIEKIVKKYLAFGVLPIIQYKNA